jgi:hypothetical protein
MQIVTQGINIATQFGINLLQILELLFQLNHLLVGFPDMHNSPITEEGETEEYDNQN